MNEPESTGRIPELGKIIKYTLIILGVTASGLVLVSSSSLIPSLAFLVIAWVLGFYLYKRREMFIDWNRSEVPLKDYILTRKKEKEENDAVLPSSRKYIPLDAVNSDGLTQNEVEKWANITEAFYIDPTSKDTKPKPRRKKEKND